MARYERFTFLCDLNERLAIANLAERLHRSQSDAVRFVVIEAARQLARTQASIPSTFTSVLPASAQEIKPEGMNVKG